MLSNMLFCVGASVAIECKDGNMSSEPRFKKEVKTNKNGEFKVQLPFSVSKHVKKIKGCVVKLISSSEPYCAIASTGTSSSLHLKSRKQGLHIFSAGFFSFKPLKQPNLCNQKPSIQNTNKDLSSDKTSFPDNYNIDPSFPPPLQDPNTHGGGNLLPFLPPLPILPELPPLPHLPGIPIPSSDQKIVKPQTFFPPNPLFPPPLVPNPLQPPSTPIIPPNPFQPPNPTPTIPNPLQPPPSTGPSSPPLFPFPSVPGLSPPSTPSLPSPPPSSLPFPFPPVFPPPGSPPPSASASTKNHSP